MEPPDEFEALIALVVYVLIEARRQSDTPRADRIWLLLSDIYTANPSLSEMLEDRRKAYAVELMIVAWRARENFLFERQQRQQDISRLPQKPAFLDDLENRLLKYMGPGRSEGASKRRLGEADTLGSTPAKKAVPAGGSQAHNLPVDDMALSQLDLDAFAELDFDAIDWSF